MILNRGDKSGAVVFSQSFTYTYYYTNIYYWVIG
jgi:hypothetical protein